MKLVNPHPVKKPIQVSESEIKEREKVTVVERESKGKRVYAKETDKKTVRNE